LEGDQLFNEINQVGFDQEENDLIDINDGLQEWNEDNDGEEVPSDDDDISSDQDKDGKKSGKDQKLKEADNSIWD
jgi:hypothetical protein